MDLIERNRQIMAEYIDIQSDDIPILEDSINIMADAGVGEIKEIVVVEAEPWCWSLQLTDINENAYYAQFSGYGNILKLCKDGPTGEELPLPTMCEGPEPMDL